MAFFVEAVLFIFKKEESKIPAIQQMVWAKSDSECYRVVLQSIAIGPYWW